MTVVDEDQSARLRWGIYLVLIAVATGNMAGRLLAVNSVDKAALERSRGGKEILQRPFLSANDRSRWMTIRSLVEQGTYEIDAIVGQPTWDTIDMVQHRGRDGQLHLYSSKPPLLATILAGEYWLLHRLTGWTLGEQPYEVGRLMLFTVNILPLVLMYCLLAKLVERFGTTDWGRVFVMAAATFGTLLTTFAVVLNNHLVAAVTRRGRALCVCSCLLRRPATLVVLCARWTCRGADGRRRPAGTLAAGRPGAAAIHPGAS